MHQNVKFEVCGHFFEHATFFFRLLFIFLIANIQDNLVKWQLLILYMYFYSP